MLKFSRILLQKNGSLFSSQLYVPNSIYDKILSKTRYEKLVEAFAEIKKKDDEFEKKLKFIDMPIDVKRQIVEEINKKNIKEFRIKKIGKFLSRTIYFITASSIITITGANIYEGNYYFF